MKRREKSPAEESWDTIWQRRATAASIIAMRKVFEDGDIPLGAPVSRLSDHQLGWLHAASLFARIKSRSEQASANGWGTEDALRITALEPQPWDAGAVAHVLREIGMLPDLDWTKPLSSWSKDEITCFLLEATKLVRAAAIARDVGGAVSDPGSLQDAATAPSAPPTPETPAGAPPARPGNGEFHDEPVPF